MEVISASARLGRLMLDALRARDVYLVAGCAGAGAIFLAAGTLVSDAALAWVDPRAGEPRDSPTRSGVWRVVAGGSRGRGGRCAVRCATLAGSVLPRPPQRTADGCARAGRRRRLARARSSTGGGSSASSSSATKRIGAPACRWSGCPAARWSGRQTRAGAPLLLLGADSYGRDVFARLVFGARVSLGLAAVAACGALLLGALSGAIAGYVGGAVDDVLMRVSEFVLILPAMYVALALRAVLPLVLAPGVVFLILAGIFAVVGAPFVARGVRAIGRTDGARLRDGSAVARCGASAPGCAAPAAGDSRIPGGGGDAARAGVHRGGGHTLVCRHRLPGSDRQLGHDASRRLELRVLPISPGC